MTNVTPISASLGEGIADAKGVAEAELRQLRAWDCDDWRKEANHG